MRDHIKEMQKELKRIIIIIIIVIINILLVISPIVASIFISYGNQQTIVGTVEEKYVKRSGDDDSYMVNIVTEDGETIVLSNEDRFFKFKFDSSDIQAQLQEGKTYKLDVCGRRIRILSSYQNIIDIEEVK